MGCSLLLLFQFSQLHLSHINIVGFEGEVCEINIDDCEDNLCQSGSTCVDLIQDYVCDCLPGYSGEFCTEKRGELFLVLLRAKNGGLEIVSLDGV